MAGGEGPPAGRPRGRPELRRAVARAARQLFIERGYDRASLDEIARRAQVSKPTIYAHYGDKAALFSHVLSEACSQLLAPIVDAAGIEQPAAQVLADLARSYRRTVLAPEMLALHRRVIAEADRFPDIGRQFFAAGPAVAHAGLADFLAARHARGEIHCPEPEIAAEIFAAMVLGPLRLRLLFGVSCAESGIDPDRELDLALRIFATGMDPARPGPDRAAG